jgi:photosystem II stability/assembly factor-like uncharacterized protein
MGFTVVGPDHFLGSGHPDGRDNLPPFLGLIESRDAGASWKPLSLLGQVDFHVLEAAGKRVYGFGSDFDSREPRFLRSSDGGRSWRRLRPPGALLALAIHPRSPDRLVASTEHGLHRSDDGGRTWRALGGEAGLLTWPAAERLYLLTNDGSVLASRDGGAHWSEAGSVGGQPAAFEADGPEDLYAALHDGTIKLSTDGGNSWTVRSTP